MSQVYTIDPVTRVEGHLSIKVDVAGGVVNQAYAAGESFRGFEAILAGRDPLDAQLITQRICGVCPIAQGMASVLAQDAAYKITPPLNGWLSRNLAAAGDFIQSHLLHFYTLSAVDFIDLTAILSYTGTDAAMTSLKTWVTQQLKSTSYFPVAPLLPRFEVPYLKDAGVNQSILKNYLTALDMRTEASKLAAMFAGKLPHAASLFPGGVTQRVTAAQITAAKASIAKLRTFINTKYIPDLIAVAKAFPEYFALGEGCGNFLSFGVFNEDAVGASKLFPSGTIIQGNVEALNISRITEDVGFARYSSGSGPVPQTRLTTPSPAKAEAYSWIKAPRYGGNVMEVGSLARVLVAYYSGKSPAVKSLVDSTLASLKRQPIDLVSVLGRHIARALECKIIADRCAVWISMLKAGQPNNVAFTIPASASGIGLTEAPRGALGHWLQISNSKISRYQCVSPTAWNASPHDDQGIPGAMEQALEGTPVADPTQPIEAVRVVRSFDPCLSCAVH